MMTEDGWKVMYIRYKKCIHKSPLEAIQLHHDIRMSIEHLLWRWKEGTINQPCSHVAEH